MDYNKKYLNIFIKNLLALSVISQYSCQSNISKQNIDSSSDLKQSEFVNRTFSLNNINKNYSKKDIFLKNKKKFNTKSLKTKTKNYKNYKTNNWVRERDISRYSDTFSKNNKLNKNQHSSNNTFYDYHKEQTHLNKKIGNTTHSSQKVNQKKYHKNLKEETQIQEQSKKQLKHNNIEKTYYDNNNLNDL